MVTLTCQFLQCNKTLNSDVNFFVLTRVLRCNIGIFLLRGSIDNKFLTNQNARSILVNLKIFIGSIAVPTVFTIQLSLFLTFPVLSSQVLYFSQLILEDGLFCPNPTEIKFYCL